jgi:uncharacterized glyoxalase superfamily protein PhnB
MTEAKPVLKQLNLVARDFDASVEFYRRLGVEVPTTEATAMGHAEAHQDNGFVLEVDNVTSAGLWSAAWRKPEGSSSRAVIGFEMPTRESVDERYDDLVAAGYEGRQRPYDTFWGSRYAIVADPDGNDVGLMSPPDKSRASWPPEPSPDF